MLSVTTVYRSIYPLRLTLPGPTATFSFSSRQGKMPHYEFCSQIFMSYWRPRWKNPIIWAAPVVFLICSVMNAGICWIISIRVIDGRQSSSFFGMMCRRRSLPSAREGVENCHRVIGQTAAYLGARGNQGRLERELVPQKYFKVEAINRFVQALGSLDRRPFHLKLKSQIKSNGRDT
jgi:hypothetical protein